MIVSWMHARKRVLNPRKGLYITIFIYDQAKVVMNNLYFMLNSLHLEDSRVRCKKLTICSYYRQGMALSIVDQKQNVINEHKHKQQGQCCLFLTWRSQFSSSVRWTLVWFHIIQNFVFKRSRCCLKGRSHDMPYGFGSS